MLCVVLWCLDEYWMYSAFTGVMLVLFECSVVHQRRRNMSTLRQMSETPTVKMSVRRGGHWVVLDSSELVPGDLVAVQPTPKGTGAPCDMIIMEGTAVVTEALLTGESTPQLKESIALREDDEIIMMRKDQRNVVFGGTTVINASRDGDDYTGAPAGAIAVVVKTGFETQQGKLIRTIVHSQSRLSSNTAEAFGFIMFLLVFAIAACAYVIQRGLEDTTRSRWKLVLTCIRIITSVVPPELPMELSLAVNTSLISLVKMKIFCTEPFRIPFAGKVDYCCFDKTGTLTCDNMELVGVDEGTGSVKTVDSLSENSVTVLGACNSLVNVGSESVGDSMERAALDAVGWTMKSSDKVGDMKGKRTLIIALRHPFSSELKRMSVIVMATALGKEARMVLTKGAPEIIKPLLKSVPSDYDDLYLKYATKGYRVLALAARTLDTSLTRVQLAALHRKDVEAELDFVGFALFNCPLKPDCKSAMEHLRSSSHRTVMVTGDNELTAVAVARELGMVEKDETVATLKLVNGTAKWTTGASDDVPRDAQNVPSGTCLCVNGEAMKTVVSQSATWLERVATNVAVWARCTPDQKEAVVLALKKLGHHVLVAGDGTNDVAALKQAHIGIAVLNAPSPTEAPAEEDPNAPLPVPPIPAEVPPLRADAGFMERVKHGAAEQQRKAMIQYRENVIRINAQRRAKAGAVVSSSTVGAAKRNPNPMGAMPAEPEDNSNAPITRLGDASIASPFTSKSSRVGAVCDILRMGRCTLVSTLQMYKILALNCLISAYSMSVLYSDGVKYGDTQMLLAGVVITICFLFVSRAQPLPRLSRERPFTRVFSLYILGSVLGQFAVHLYALVESVRMVDNVDAAERLESAKLVDDETFKPTLLNSIVFLMSTMMTVTTFAVNYRGHPFMTGLRENKPLWNAILVLTGSILVISLELLPEFNEYMEIVKMPTDEFRNRFFGLLVMDAVLVLAIDRTLLYFCRDSGDRDAVAAEKGKIV
eukprot:PhM_4_TR8032/c0_g2_i1/m.41264/K14950/ATP13A1, SPF1; manganese-transporting P-type ATPase